MSFQLFCPTKCRIMTGDNKKRAPISALFFVHVTLLRYEVVGVLCDDEFLIGRIHHNGDL